MIFAAAALTAQARPARSTACLARRNAAPTRFGKTATRSRDVRSICRSSCCRRSRRSSSPIRSSCCRAALATRRHSTRGSSAARFRTPGRHDLVLVDLRGTGKSAPLTCPELGRPTDGIFDANLLSVAAVRACRARLEKTADLRLHHRDSRGRSRGGAAGAQLRTNQSLRHLLQSRRSTCAGIRRACAPR